ncbi:MAG: histidine phosphatase family protein [Sulfitobacter sp.]
MIRIALLRHGHTSWNRAGRIQGRSDIPLDAEATSQLSGLELPKDWRHAQVTSSPLNRAVQTAQLVAGQDPEIVHALMEMNWGDWEGQRGADLRAQGLAFKDIEDWGWNYTPPNGEAPANLRERLSDWLNGVSQDTIAVCHIGVMRVLLAMATDWHFAGPAPFQVKRNRLYVLHLSGDQMTLAPDTPRLVARTT